MLRDRLGLQGGMGEACRQCVFGGRDWNGRAAARVVGRAEYWMMNHAQCLN